MPSGRFNRSWLGALERPALARLAGAMPAWVTPDHLTAAGFAGALVAAAGYIGCYRSVQFLWLSCAGLVLHWLGDSLDGTLARLRRIERPRYGFFVDTVSDVFAHAIVFLSVGLSPCAHFNVACLALIAFYIAYAYMMIHAHVTDTLRITFFGFGATEIRALFLGGNLITLAVGLFDFGPWLGVPAAWRPVTLFDLGMSVLAATGTAMIVCLAVREGRMLSAQDVPPGHPRRRHGEHIELVE